MWSQICIRSGNITKTVLTNLCLKQITAVFVDDHSCMEYCDIYYISNILVWLLGQKDSQYKREQEFIFLLLLIFSCLQAPISTWECLTETSSCSWVPLNGERNPLNSAECTRSDLLFPSWMVATGKLPLCSPDDVVTEKARKKSQINSLYSNPESWK